MNPQRTVLALLLGALVGFAVAISSGVLAERGNSRAELPAQDTRLLVEVLDRIKGDYVERVDDHELMSHAIRGMVTGLDPHSSFMDAGEFEDLRIATEGNYSGIGIEVTLEGGAIIVVTAIEGSPADHAGLQPGDSIIAIDGREVDRNRLGDSIARMRGRPGSQVRVTLLREGEAEPLEIQIERAEVIVPSVRHAMLEPGLGYVRISQFSDTTGDDVELALHMLQQHPQGPLRGLVLDLRNNPGGVLDAAVQVSDAFLERGLIVSAKGRTPDARFRLKATPGDLSDGADIAVLINGGSASASEIVAGALRDHGRATLVGRTSFGKGSVQTVLPLSDGQAIKLTTSRYYTPSGTSIQDHGIDPDLELPRQPPARNTPWGEVDSDPELRAAIDMLKRKGASVQRAAASVPGRSS